MKNMNIYIKNIPTGLCVFLFFLFSFAAVGTVLALDTGLTKSADTAGYKTDESANLQTFIGYAIQAVLGLVGTLFFAILVYGGIMWMFAEGDQNKITKARGMIFYAVAGILLVLGAYAITSFVTTEIATKALKE